MDRAGAAPVGAHAAWSTWTDRRYLTSNIPRPYMGYSYRLSGLFAGGVRPHILVFANALARRELPDRASSGTAPAALGDARVSRLWLRNAPRTVPAVKAKALVVGLWSRRI